MNHLIESYYSPVFNSVVRLTGRSDEKELKPLTEKILAELHKRTEEWESAERKGVFVYRVVLTHVFSFLQAEGDFPRIDLLRKILLIHPSYYLRLPE